MRILLSSSITSTLLALSSCQAVGDPAGVATFTVRTESGSDANASPQDPEPREAPARRPASRPLADQARALLRSDSFQRRLVESYVAETETEPSFDEDEREILFEVMAHVTAERLDEAEALVRQHVGERASAVFDFTLGNILFQRDDFVGAAAAYETAVQKHPRFRRAWGNLAQIHYTEADYENAKRAIARVLGFGSGDAVTYALLGDCHNKTGDSIAAESAFRMAIMLDPESVEWRMALAESLFRQSRFEDAIALFDHLIAEYPNRADLWMLQGEAYAMLEKPLKAAENFELVDQLGASTAASLNNLGSIYASQGLFDLAVDSYLRALRKHPDGEILHAVNAAHYLSGNSAYVEMRALIEGIESISGTHLSNDDRKKLMKLRARLAMAEGADQEQVDQLQRVVALDPLDGEALILLGRHFGRVEDAERAFAYFEQAANLEEFEAEATLRHGEVLAKQSRFAEALPLLKRSQELRPRDYVQKYVEDIEKLARTSK